MRPLTGIAIVLGAVLLLRTDRAVAQVPAPGAPTATTATPTPPVDSVKLELIRAVLAQTHAVDIMFQSMEAALPMQRAANPNIPAAFRDRFARRSLEPFDE